MHTFRRRLHHYSSPFLLRLPSHRPAQPQRPEFRRGLCRDGRDHGPCASSGLNIDKKLQVASLTKNPATAMVVLDWKDATKGDLAQFATVPPQQAASLEGTPWDLHPGDEMTSARPALHGLDAIGQHRRGHARQSCGADPAPCCGGSRRVRLHRADGTPSHADCADCSARFSSTRTASTA